MSNTFGRTPPTRDGARRFRFLAVVGVVIAAFAVVMVSMAGASNREPARTTAATMVGVKHNGTLGSILFAGSKHMTVYMFAKDHGSKSTCSGACASTWPPVTTTGQPKATGGAGASDLGTIDRSGGVMQVTYKGHPLYYFAGDQSAADASGQRLESFGAPWYVLAANGQVIKAAKR
jgi:predicted lipoprotein with Yx(FWY)xxD motif